MINKYIKELHQKPESHRRKVAYGSSAIITAVIGLVWFSSFGYLNGFAPSQDAQDQTDGAKVAQVQKSSDNTGPVAVIGSNIANAYDAVRQAFGAKALHTPENQKTTATLEYVPE